MNPTDARPLVLHVVNRFDTGGLENGVVNLINHMPALAYRHAVLALTQVTDFRQRVQRPDVGFLQLDKPAGHGIKLYPRVRRLLRELQPAVVHTRNLGPLELQPAAAWAGVPARIHSEHGWEMGDLKGVNRKDLWLRRLYAPWTHHQIALSKDIQAYLHDRVRLPGAKLTQIYNGVDTQRFSRARDPAAAVIPGAMFSAAQGHWLVGTVGRMKAVKNQTLLARAFIEALQREPALRARLRLVMVGDGPLREEAQRLLAEAGLADLAWLPGERSDIPDVMRGLHAFVLPSLAEGISNTILEAMASGLPVVATDVGGNAELVRDGRTGRIVPSDDVDAMASALLELAADPQRARTLGAAARAEVEARFSLPAMVAAYQAVYDRALARAGRPQPQTAQRSA